MDKIGNFDHWYRSKVLELDDNKKVFNIVGMESQFKEFMNKTKLRAAFNCIGISLRARKLKIVIAGGIFSCFVKNIPITDIDVFSNADSIESFKTVVSIMHDILTRYFDVSIVLRKNAINFNITTQTNKPKTYIVQLITTSYSSVELLLDNFDINIVKVIYFPICEEIYYTKSAFYGYYNLSISVENMCRSTKYRIYKFVERGFCCEYYNHWLPDKVLPYLIHTNKYTISIAMQFMPIEYKELYDILCSGQLYFKITVKNIDVYINCDLSFKYPSDKRGLIRINSNVINPSVPDDVFIV